MGISVVCEQTVEENHLQSLYGKFAWQAGLVIGRVTPKKHLVVTLLPTPQDINDTNNNDDVDELPLDFGPPKGSFANLDVKLAAIQAENVRQALPGGLDIIGVYMFGPPTDANSTKLRTLLYAVCASKAATSVVDQFSEMSGETKSMERVAVHLCSKTKKLTCRSYDIADKQASARPGTWKYTSFVDKWQKISCDFDANIEVSLATKTTSAVEAVIEALEPTLQRISSSQLVLPNKTSDNEIKGTLFCKRQATTAPSDKPKEVCASLNIVGTIKAIAFLPPKSTLLDSKLAVQIDIERSLLTRCGVLCENLDEDESTDEGFHIKTQQLALPARVSVPFVNQIHISHYCADVDEQNDLSECAVLLKNFFDVQLNVDDVVFHERIADTPALSTPKPTHSSTPETKSGEQVRVRGDGNGDGGGGMQMQMLVPAVAFAVIAIVIGLYMALS
eukprot:m.145816 g.145816  ORF g.145816 m.145816 type:complete len:447 (+) comp30455_c0_seq3:252-1592(+)